MHMFYRVTKEIYQFAANLLSYIPAKYYWNRSTSDLVIAKSRRVNFFWNTVYILVYLNVQNLPATSGDDLDPELEECFYTLAYSLFHTERWMLEIGKWPSPSRWNCRCWRRDKKDRRQPSVGWRHSQLVWYCSFVGLPSHDPATMLTLQFKWIQSLTKYSSSCDNSYTVCIDTFVAVFFILATIYHTWKQPSIFQSWCTKHIRSRDVYGSHYCQHLQLHRCIFHYTMSWILCNINGQRLTDISDESTEYRRYITSKFEHIRHFAVLQMMYRP